MRSVSLTVAEGTNLNKSLEFTARAVQIDNITSSWIWVEGGGRFVPPFQYGVIVPLEGTAQGNLRWQTPVGIPVPTAGSATAQVVFTEAALPASNGQPVTIPSQQILCTLSGLNVTGGSAAKLNGTTTISTTGTGIIASGVLSVTVNLAPGTNSLIITGSVAGSSAGVLIVVTGVQSGTTYYSGNVSLGAPTQNLPVEFIVSPAADNALIVSFTSGSIGNVLMTTVGFVASFGTQAVAVEGIIGNSLNVQLTGAAGANPISPQPVLNKIQALPVVVWPQAGSMSSVAINGGIVSGSVITLVAGSVGSRIIIMGLYANLAGTGVQVVDFQGSSSGVIWSFRCEAGNTQLPPVNLQPGGLALATGESFQFTGESAVNIAMRGLLLYTIGM